MNVFVYLLAVNKRVLPRLSLQEGVTEVSYTNLLPRLSVQEGGLPVLRINRYVFFIKGVIMRFSKTQLQKATDVEARSRYPLG